MAKLIDDYDDKFGDMKFSCDLVMSLRWAFFGTGVNKPAEKKIIKHLLGCPKCRDAYEKYAEKIGYGKFDAIQYAMKYLKNEDKEIKLTANIEKPKDEWVTKVSNNEILKLARSKAMREIIMEVTDESFRDFLMLKIAKRLDHLEECYEKEYEVIKNEKS